MKSPTIFISYNSRSEAEQTLDVRLHTIGSVNGFNMLLPDRNSNLVISDETKNRINQSNYFVLFSFGKTSIQVETEMDQAFFRFKDKSRIIVIKPGAARQSIKSPAKFTQIYFDPKTESVDTIIQKIIKSIFHKQRTIKTIAAKKEKEAENGLVALLGVGLGLYALHEIFKGK